MRAADAGGATLTAAAASQGPGLPVRRERRGTHERRRQADCPCTRIFAPSRGNGGATRARGGVRVVEAHGLRRAAAVRVRPCDCDSQEEGASRVGQQAHPGGPGERGPEDEVRQDGCLLTEGGRGR